MLLGDNKYAVIVTGHGGTLGPKPGLLDALARHRSPTTAGGGSEPAHRYAAFVSDETYHFVAPFGSPAELDAWPSLEASLGKGGSEGIALNKEINAAFPTVDTQIVKFRSEYTHWPDDKPLPSELIVVTLSVDHKKWDEFHSAALKLVNAMKAQADRHWITVSNKTGDASRLHILIDAAAPRWWKGSQQYADLLKNVNYTLEKRIAHRPAISTLN